MIDTPLDWMIVGLIFWAILFPWLLRWLESLKIKEIKMIVEEEWMNKKLILLSMLGAIFSFRENEGETTISSHKIKTPKQHIELSKRKRKKMKGKKERENRGKNRK